jgi:magnesium transporter
MESMIDERLSPMELHEAWPALSAEERAEGFRMLPRDQAEDFFVQLETREQRELLLALPNGERRSYARLLPPDDLADIVQETPEEEREALLGLLDPVARKEVQALLAYKEDEAGGLMNPRYVRLRPEMSVDEAIAYLRKRMREPIEMVAYGYVLDNQQRLLGVVSYRSLVTAPPDKRVQDIMHGEPVTVPEEMDQEAVSHLFAKYNLIALPVVDAEGRMKGVVTGDDIVDVVKEEATEDIHKIGAVQALGAPYLQVSLLQMIRKRGGWLAALFLGEMLTATAMGFFEAEIAKAVVLALFIPLIISSGGNSGSQASTLVVRAMALGEVRLREWWRVLMRELPVGLALGGILGAIGLLRILLWQAASHCYGEHYMLVALTVALSLVGVVLWGTVMGSMLPLLLRRLGADPASASAPFVATLVDVTGLIIYFTCAIAVMRGVLL